MLRIGVLGAGAHSAGSHGAALKAYKTAHPDEIELAAICDLDEVKAKAYAETFGFARVHTDWQRMVDSEQLDGLMAITPVGLTHQIAAELLPLGLPLMIEKPPGEHSSETRELLDIAHRHGTPHMVSFNRRFIPAVQWARDWLDRHADRPPRVCIARMLRHARTEPEFAVGTGIHLVDTVLSLMGEPAHVSTERLATAVEGCYQYVASVRFASGAAASLIISTTVGTNEETYELHGQDYCLKIDTTLCSATLCDNAQEPQCWTAPDDVDPSALHGSLGETEMFVRGIRGEVELRPTLSDALASMLVSEAIDRGGGAEIDLGS